MTSISDQLESLLHKEAFFWEPERTAISLHTRDSRLKVKRNGAVVHTKPFR